MCGSLLRTTYFAQDDKLLAIALIRIWNAAPSDVNGTTKAMPFPVAPFARSIGSDAELNAQG